MPTRKKNPRKPEEEYEVTGIVEPKDIPTWARRERKWQDLLDTVMQLEPGKVLQIRFKSEKAADTARNQVRDEINRLAGAAVLATHMVPDESEEGQDPATVGATVYFEKRSVAEAKAKQRDT